MKTKKIFLHSLLCMILILGLAEIASAGIPGDSLGLRNPFKSWLPKIEEIIEKVPEPTKIDIEKPEPISSAPLSIIQPPQVIAESREEELPKLVVNGVIWGTSKPQAIVNDHVVSIGDTIENSQIVNIHQDGVDIIFSNKLHTIKIDPMTTQAI